MVCNANDASVTTPHQRNVGEATKPAAEKVEHPDMDYKGKFDWEARRKAGYDHSALSFLGLRYKADRRTLTMVFLYYLSFATLMIKGSTMDWLPWTLLFVTNCYLSFVGATITHNTMHCQVFKSEYRWRNKIFQHLLTLSYGHPVSTYVPGHNLSHHKYTQLPKDAMRTTKLRYSHHLVNLVLFQPSVARHILKNDLRYMNLQGYLKRPYYEQCVREFQVLFAVSAALLFYSPWMFLLYFYIPHNVAQMGIVNMNLLQHDGCDVVEPGVKGVNTARNFTGWFINYTTMNNGYHTMHHFYPIMHWSLLPEAHDLIVKPHIHPSLDQPNMLWYIIKTFVMNNRVNYDGTPVKLTGPEPEDEDWMVYPEGVKREDLEMITTPKDMLRRTANWTVLSLAKLCSPLYSPRGSVI